MQEAERGGHFWVPMAVIDYYGDQLGPLGIVVYMVLAYHADWGGACCPSYRRIAVMLGISRRHAMRGVQRLEELGLVAVERSPGSGAANTYQLLLDDLP